MEYELSMLAYSYNLSTPEAEFKSSHGYMVCEPVLDWTILPAKQLPSWGVLLCQFAKEYLRWPG